MTESEIRLPPGELVRLAECVLEPIRFPGNIQPHGAFIVAGRDGMRISHASDNTTHLLGVDPIALLGRPLGDLLGERVVAELRSVLDPGSTEVNPVAVTLGEGTGEHLFDAIVHESGQLVMIDLEPIDPAFVDESALLWGAFRRLSAARTVEQLWADTATELKRITGYDRVMVYHFHADGHGEIVAEQVVEGMEPYLGLHYPASDIPAQSRDLYLRKLSRLIASSGTESAALLADANSELPERLDLGGAELRSVSPHHLEFMRNMGQASTFSLSLVRAGELVGMITCAHQTDRRLPFAIREGLEILVNQVSLQLGSMLEIERLGEKDRVRELRATLLGQIGADSLAGGLMEHPLTVLDYIPADGAVLSFRGQLHRVGTVPEPAQVKAFIAGLASEQSDLSFVSNALPLDYPLLAAAVDPVAGVLVQPFASNGDFIAWFRGEVMRTVDWLGDMSPANRVTPLSPRNSFSAWSEDVTGTSAAWNGADEVAAELSRELDSVLLHRAEAELAELALRDSLTGLPNRRVLMDRLAQAIERTPGTHDLAVLFVDVDQFKAINDSLGHAAGDAALLLVADALRSVVRIGDTIARLGGDEFVVLCERTTPADAELVAARVIESLAAAGSGAGEWQVSASIGVAFGGRDSTASQLLSAADAAMYRAKVAGRARVSL